VSSISPLRAAPGPARTCAPPRTQPASTHAKHTHTMSTFLPRSLLLPLCVAVAATPAVLAQSAPNAHSHDHADEPVQLENLVVTASPVARTQADLLSSTNVLAGAALQEARQPTLGETLADLPGVSSTYFGPGSSRPVIRGLSANRVRVLANSTDTLDASNTSPDHAVSVEPFLVKRIEVVRGPAALLYGSSAVGGVVNVIDHRIESALPDRDLSGVLDSSFTDNGQGYAVGGAIDIALGADRENNSGFVLHLDAFRREADDLDVPGRSGQEDDLGNPLPAGRLYNSALDSEGGSVGLSYVSEVFDVGVNFNGFDTSYGIPFEASDEVVSIDLRQRRIDAAATYKRDFGVFEEARVKLGYADYQHKEIEGGAVGTVFDVEGIDSRLELINGEVAGWTGALGLQLGTTDTSAAGDEAFLPTHTTDNGALFLFQELARDRTTWQVGARIEHRTIDAAPFVTSEPGVVFGSRGDDRTTFSGSLGAIYSLSEPYKLAWNASYTERAPNGQELFAYGPHHGTEAYEIGDESLSTERAFGYELSLRKTTGLVTGSLTGFAQYFDGYIFEEGTGITVDEENTPDPTEHLERTFFVQRNALFYGFEAEAVWHLHNENRHTLDLTTAVDYVRAEDTDGDDLPRIPALKTRIALDWRKDGWHVGPDLVLVAKQSNSAPGENDTDGYALLGLTLGYCLETRHATYDFFVRGANLTDEEARLHTSFLKEIAPLPGRSFTAGVRASF
jgi:iron complex outermembrane receptor protein